MSSDNGPIPDSGNMVASSSSETYIALWLFLETLSPVVLILSALSSEFFLDDKRMSVATVPLAAAALSIIIILLTLYNLTA